MFNLTVDEAHTFYVGQDGWLVHNAGKPPLTKTERSVMAEATRYFKPEVMQKFFDAFNSGKPTFIQVGNRTILVEPGYPSSGFTNYEGKSFGFGKEAFQSVEEYRKTVFHELTRIYSDTGTVRQVGVGGRFASSATSNAFETAEKLYSYMFGGCKV